MDIRPYMFTDDSSSCWEPYNLEAANMIHNHLNPFDHPQFPPRYAPPQTLEEPSSRLPAVSSFYGVQEPPNLKSEEEPEEELGAMKEILFKIAAMQPVDIDPVTIRKPKRRNVRISDDPQSVAARLRRERISEKIRILQRLVPGGAKMDTASMLDEAIRYVKFLKRQIRFLQGTSHQKQSAVATTSADAFGGLASSYLFDGKSNNDSVYGAGDHHQHRSTCCNPKFISL